MQHRHRGGCVCVYVVLGIRCNRTGEVVNEVTVRERSCHLQTTPPRIHWDGEEGSGEGAVVPGLLGRFHSQAVLWSFTKSLGKLKRAVSMATRIPKSEWAAVWAAFAGNLAQTCDLILVLQETTTCWLQTQRVFDLVSTVPETPPRGR